MYDCIPARRLPASKTRPFGAMLRAAVLLCAATIVAPAPASAADYPSNPVHLIVPFAPGGAVDGIGRLTAQALAKELGQQVVVENKPGAGGVIGITAAAHAAPDGYTVLMGNIALASAPALYDKLTFNPAKDFAGIATIGKGPYVLVVPAKFPAHTLKQLIQLAKEHPGKYNFASAGTGSAIHLAGELFKSMAQINIVHVPFKGAGPAATALLGGQVQMMFGSLMEMMPLIQSGKVRALGVSSLQRTKYAPKIPTIAESGLPGFEVTGWYGLFVPAATPPAIVAKLSSAANRALKASFLQEQLPHYKLDPVGGTPAQTDKFLGSEIAKWTKVVHDAHIKAN
ncbi:tripartite tricarboxylate transporter substrate binding protein [Candidimonas humi]|uniref:Bug family tripartite tricarboxylate transporter substrate binding protein n=1 Tax=Candidimonas humi TaxID=683355 RepID=A0ABV8NSB2_9BURK|nr:tripartite tricarboxylate transporter substrate binding protein [Candidimonas humi]MBV6303282.1 tripartite tricarboxylate transporter substrate binding protein [Candidimonas humi]